MRRVPVLKQHRDTRQRNIVLSAVQARCDHPSADQIYTDVQAVDKRISRGTVYRNLHVLAQNGKINHIKLPGADRFDRRLDPHYHLLCTSCGAVCDVSIPYRSSLDKAAAKESGCRIEGHRTLFEGLCPRCLAKSPG